MVRLLRRALALVLIASVWLVISVPVLGKAEITLGFKGTHEDFEVILQLVEEFNRLNPDIEAVAINIAAGGSWIDRLNVWFAGGTPPDVIKMEYARAVGYVSQGFVQPLDHFIARDVEFDINDFFPISIAAHTFSGQKYAIPQEAQPMTVFVNRTHMDQVGIPMPSNDWTVDELLEAAKKGTIDVSGDGEPDIYGWQFDTSFTRTEPFLKAFGGQLLSDDGQQFILDHPNNLRALQFFHDAIHIHGVKGGAFQRGNVLFYSFGGPWSVPQYRSSLPDMEWDILPSPAGPGGQATTFASDGYYIASATDYPDEAWELVKFITNAESLRRLMRHGTIVPPRPGLIDDFLGIYRLGDQPPRNVNAYMKGIEIASPSVVYPNFVAAEQLFKNTLDGAWAGRYPVETAVQQMLPLLNNLLRE